MLVAATTMTIISARASAMPPMPIQIHFCGIFPVPADDMDDVSLDRDCPMMRDVVVGCQERASFFPLYK